MGTNKGNYYKRKTKAYFEADGYVSEYLEKLQHIFTKGRVIYIKRDLLGADGLAVNDTEFILWNSIANKGDVASHIKRFKEFPNPSFIKRYIVYWEARAREPELIDVDVDFVE